MTKAEEILREIEKKAERSYLPIVGHQKGQILVETIRKTRPKHLLEIGTLVGYSAILMGKELDSDDHLITIEIHRDEAKTAKENIKRSDILPKVEVLVGNASVILQKLQGRFDLVFLDNNKDEYLTYLRLVEDKLHKGSVIVADNAGIYGDTMEDYLTYVRTSGKYDSKYISVEDDGVELSVKL